MLQTMDATQSTEAVFTATAAAYDTDRAKLLPGYPEFYGAALRELPESTDHVLDLGAGTGLLSAWVRGRFPSARLHLIDNSQAMLAQARERFADDRQITFKLGDYRCCEWGDRYDAVVSALSIHHLSDANKRALFTRIFTVLKPGGVFVNAEQILQPTAELEVAAKERWLAEAREAGATEQQVADSLFRQTQDRCATVAEQLRWLAEAGFVAAHCTWQRGRFAVLTAVTPS